ncbi:oxidoreductase [Sphingobium sp. 22B]|uniref:SDR family oxidoreductase n=1 Tax=unclassified Sphingobium TaxID=2611147 RepID=UPI000782F35A|nr:MULTISPECIES: SDR family oxidoreductase [unclassified Sphingobium]KXU33855.1 oxidoreductase [Sphingobium sp. AM]KYC33800.1 oxidoreductase [Sphingobium sp. 22B]OAP33534.1 oxidoreductase [Sphingobium sp. 20006FA]
MVQIPYKTALVVGTGPGIGTSVARALSAAGARVAVAARNSERLSSLAQEIGGAAFAVDATDAASVAALFDDVDRSIGIPEVVLFNAAGRVRGPVTDIDPGQVRHAIEVSAYGGFLVLQQAARRLVPLGHGAILLTGATASVKGFANSSGFAIGKFGLRGLAQSAARELAPKGIHVAHFVIDGGVRSAGRPDPTGAPDSTLDPDAIADAYLAVLAQHRSAWSWEVELRPWVEPF